jgi:hypothetical protein
MEINQAKLNKVLTGTREERVYLCEMDFSLFFIYYFTEYLKYDFAPFHLNMFQDIQDIMNGKIREIAWLMFRESAKTSIAKAFLTWLIVYKKRGYINADSFDKENAERALFDIVVELQTNKFILSDFGQLFNSKRNPDEITQKRVNNFVTNNGVRVEAHSTQESVRGRIHGSQRPDCLLLDDFETNKTKDSKAYTEQVIKHINEFKSGLDSKALIIYLGNYITEFGSVQELINRSKEDVRLRLRMVPVIEDGKITWPAKYTMTDAEALGTDKVSLEDKKKLLGSLVFAAEMMNQPIDEASQEFFKTNFRYRTMEEVLALNTRKFATIDSALSKNSEDDKTGVVENYVDMENNWNISGYELMINSKSLIDLIFTLHDRGFELIGIEETAYTQAIQPFFEDECRKRNKFPRVIMLKHGGIMKETRIRGLIPRYETKSIFHITGHCDKLEEQLLKFPKSIYDDVIDAEQYQLKLAEPPRNVKKIMETLEKDTPLYPDIGL